MPNPDMLDVLHRDDHLIAVHKPSGLLVHRSMLDRHETRFALQMVRDQIGRHVYAVHRLDKGTSGVLLFALDEETGRSLSQAFETRAVEKTYLAVVRGWPDAAGTIDHPLSRQRDHYEFKPGEDNSPPQHAVTHYRRLATVEFNEPVDRYPTRRYALVELQPETGRRHQLRRHLKHLSHPIIGDATYGKGQHNRFFQQRFGCQRMLLACTALRLTHPASGETLIIQAALAEDFMSVLRQLMEDTALPEPCRHSPA